MRKTQKPIVTKASASVGTSISSQTPLLERMCVNRIFTRGSKQFAVATIGRDFELPLWSDNSIHWSRMDPEERLNFAIALCMVERCCLSYLPTSLYRSLREEDRRTIHSMTENPAFKPYLAGLVYSSSDRYVRASLLDFYIGLHSDDLETRVKAFVQFLDCKLYDDELTRARLRILGDALGQERDPDMIKWITEILSLEPVKEIMKEERKSLIVPADASKQRRAKMVQAIRDATPPGGFVPRERKTSTTATRVRRAPSPNQDPEERIDHVLKNIREEQRMDQVLKEISELPPLPSLGSAPSTRETQQPSAPTTQLTPDATLITKDAKEQVALSFVLAEYPELLEIIERKCNGSKLPITLAPEFDVVLPLPVVEGVRIIQKKAASLLRLYLVLFVPKHGKLKALKTQVETANEFLDHFNSGKGVSVAGLWLIRKFIQTSRKVEQDDPGIPELRRLINRLNGDDFARVFEKGFDSYNSEYFSPNGIKITEEGSSDFERLASILKGDADNGRI